MTLLINKLREKMDRTNYDQITSSIIAWAYLRKNPGYHIDQRQHAVKGQASMDSGIFPCARQTQSDVGAEKWGLLHYADPTEGATPFWHPDKSRITVAAEVLDTKTGSGAPAFIPMLRKANANVRGLRLLDGRLCLNIASGELSTQMMFPIKTVLDENSPIQLILPFGLDFQVQTRNATTLWDILNSKAKKTSVFAPIPS